MTGGRPPDRVRPSVRGGWWSDERGVSFTVSYVLTVAIAVVLVAGLSLSVGHLVRDQQTESIRSEATVVGDQTAAAVMASDRLVQRGTSSAVSVALRLPDRLGGQPYTVTLEASATNADVVVSTRSPSVTVSVPLRNGTHIEEATVAGPDVRVVHDVSDGTLTLADGES